MCKHLRITRKLNKARMTTLTLIMLFTTTPTFANSVDPDQMASVEAI